MELSHIFLFFSSLLSCIFCQNWVSPFCSTDDIEVPCDNYLGVGVICKVIVVRPTECLNVDFKSLTKSTSEATGKELGEATLSSYLYTNFGSTPHLNVNVTFTDIGWTNMTMRFVAKGANSTLVCCRHFVLNSTIRSSEIAHKNLSPTTIFWDCRWFDSSFEGRFMTLEYLSMNEYFYEHRMFLFLLPRLQNFDIRNPKRTSWHSLVYVEEFGDDVIAHWEQPPHQNTSTFRVNVSDCSNKSLIMLTVVEENTLKHQFHKFQSSCITRCCVISVEPWLSHLQKWGSPCLSVPLEAHALPFWNGTNTASIVLTLLFGVPLVCLLIYCTIKCHQVDKKQNPIHLLFLNRSMYSCRVDCKTTVNLSKEKHSGPIDEAEDPVISEHLQSILKFQDSCDEEDLDYTYSIAAESDELGEIGLSCTDFQNLVKASYEENEVHNT